ncbi:MAG: hypothetical protein EZS28_016731 [Streblomastix strix]|uniref:Uncharacterized protein n=1 Tax=Streblomastix strix TaxID=222440 RepID=A0A5J4VYY5_9EUKA|nr:MAG: hypothetical protein EZS28_016731 [Streblomastix strix]
MDDPIICILLNEAFPPSIRNIFSPSIYALSLIITPVIVVSASQQYNKVSLIKLVPLNAIFDIFGFPPQKYIGFLLITVLPVIVNPSIVLLDPPTFIIYELDSF